MRRCSLCGAWPPVIDAIAIEKPPINLRHLGGGRYDGWGPQAKFKLAPS